MKPVRILLPLALPLLLLACSFPARADSPAQKSPSRGESPAATLTSHVPGNHPGRAHFALHRAQ